MVISEVKRTKCPNYGLTVDGYTKKTGAPTSLMVKIDNEKRWRRLMIWQFSNVGTLFVRVNGRPIIVNEYDIPSFS